MYSFLPENGKWQLYMFDLDWLMLAAINYSSSYGPLTAPLFNSEDPTISRMYAHPPFLRAYWRAVQDAINGPLDPAQCNPVMDAKYKSLVENGVAWCDGQALTGPAAVKTWFSQRRTGLQNQLATVASPFTVNATVTVSNGVGVITGTAPVNVGTIAVNGAEWTVRWTTVNNWVATVPLQTGSNFFSVVGLDVNGQIVAGASNGVALTYNRRGAIAGGHGRSERNHVQPVGCRTRSMSSCSTPRRNQRVRPVRLELQRAGLHVPRRRVHRPARLPGAGQGSDRLRASPTGRPSRSSISFRQPAGRRRDARACSSRARPQTSRSSWTGSATRPDRPGRRPDPGVALQLRDPAQDNARAANWAVGGTNSIALATPGASNSVVAVLPAFPPVWLNELQADNQTGPVDNYGQRDPWVELYNAGTNALSLGGYSLSDNYTNLARWNFPSNVVIPGGGFLVVWCDSETNQATAAASHASFRLASGGGRVALSRRVGGTNQLVDYLTCPNLPSNWSYGDLPDGQPFYRGQMFFVTAGGTNNSASPPITLFINEWLADNGSSLADPADDNFEDWFELYNPGTNAVDLGGYYLTDDLDDQTKFEVPQNGQYLVPPGGYLLVWADNETEQNGTNCADLHAKLALSKGGEAIGIFAADGTRIDAVTFGSQTTDVSEGRFPDGAATILPLFICTPRAPNRLPNTAPSLSLIPDQEVTLGQTLTFTAGASDTDVPAQQLTFSLGDETSAGAAINSISGQFQWTPKAAPADHTLAVIVSDDGQPSLSATQTFQVTVYLPPTLGVEIEGEQLRLSWPRGTLQEADDVSGPYRDVTTQSPLTVDLTESRRFYRIRL